MNKKRSFGAPEILSFSQFCSVPWHHMDKYIINMQFIIDAIFLKLFECVISTILLRNENTSILLQV